jgi:hypothetical protein
MAMEAEPLEVDEKSDTGAIPAASEPSLSSLPGGEMPQIRRWY